MNDTFYDGHDEIYHHTKFGEDRTMRAMCRCENVLFTGRIPRSGKLPVLNLFTGQKWGFFAPGATRCTDSRQTWQGRRARWSAWLCKISPQLPQAVGMRPAKYQNFPLFGKESTRRFNTLFPWPISKIFKALYITVSNFIWFAHRLRSYCWETRNHASVN